MTKRKAEKASKEIVDNTANKTRRKRIWLAGMKLNGQP